MSAIALIVSVAVPIAVILFIVLVVSERQRIQLEKAKQSRKVRQRAEVLLEAIEFLILADDHRDLQRLLLDRVADLFALAHQLAPSNVSNQSQSFDPAPYQQKIASNPGVRRILKSDRELRYCRQQFSEALKSVNAIFKKKTITATAAVEYRRYLKMTLLEREVDTYTAQGDVAAARNDVVTASSYYKAARQRLISFDVQFPEKNDRIKVLADKTAALYQGQKDAADAKAAANEGQNQEKTPNMESSDNLTRTLDKEDSSKTSAFGIPLDP
ncbi:MAG: hypothetical protein P1U57_06360, partial [Oleibacter sp.]|nr:hypothetical protein [Thalassolituus sp.]